MSFLSDLFGSLGGAVSSVVSSPMKALSGTLKSLASGDIKGGLSSATRGAMDLVSNNPASKLSDATIGKATGISTADAMRTALPVAATVFGGPLGGMAYGMVANQLGPDSGLQGGNAFSDIGNKAGLGKGFGQIAQAGTSAYLGDPTASLGDVMGQAATNNLVQKQLGGMVGGNAGKALNMYNAYDNDDYTGMAAASGVGGKNASTALGAYDNYDNGEYDNLGDTSLEDVADSGFGNSNFQKAALQKMSGSTPLSSGLMNQIQGLNNSYNNGLPSMVGISEGGLNEINPGMAMADNYDEDGNLINQEMPEDIQQGAEQQMLGNMSDDSYQQNQADLEQQYNQMAQANQQDSNSVYQQAVQRNQLAQQVQQVLSNPNMNAQAKQAALAQFQQNPMFDQIVQSNPQIAQMVQQATPATDYSKLGGVSSLLGGLAGGVGGYMAASPERDQAMQLQQQLTGNIQNTPITNTAKALALQQYTSAGNLNPELEKQINNQESQDTKNARALTGQALQGISQDARTGLGAQDVAAMQKLRGQAQQDAQSKIQQIMQSQQQRGIAGSGDELAAQLSSAQNAYNTESQGGLDQAAKAAALRQSSQANLAQLGNQQAQQLSAIDQLNLQNQVAQQQRNVSTQNTAQQMNLSNAQNIANQNTGLANTEANRQATAQQQYDQTKLGQAVSAGYQGQNLAQQYGQQGAARGNMVNQIGQGVGNIGQQVLKQYGAPAQQNQGQQQLQQPQAAQGQQQQSRPVRNPNQQRQARVSQAPAQPAQAPADQNQGTFVEKAQQAVKNPLDFLKNVFN